MTAHDPRVTLTEAEIERLCDALEDSDAEYRVEQRVAREVERIIAARLAPIRALAAEWAAKYGTCGCPTNGGEQLRAALEAPGADLSASQDHDGAEQQGERGLDEHQAALVGHFAAMTPKQRRAAINLPKGARRG